VVLAHEVGAVARAHGIDHADARRIHAQGREAGGHGGLVAEDDDAGQLAVTDAPGRLQGTVVDRFGQDDGFSEGGSPRVQ